MEGATQLLQLAQLEASTATSRAGCGPHFKGADLLRLPLHTVPTRDLAGEALAIAVVQGITAYDAAYVALSLRLSLPLVTADESLVRRLEGSSLDVRWLGEWPRVPPVGRVGTTGNADR